jgi:hypothetical protein
MRVDFSSQQYRADEVQQFVRLARIARAAVGSVIVGAIGYMVVASIPPGASDRGVIDASVSEMQLYAVPPGEVSDDAVPNPSAGAARSVDEGLGRLDGVVHHG